MIRALVVDDCGAALRLLSCRLARAGFEVLEARDGLAGLQRAVEDRPDMIFVRAELGGIDGFELCTRIHAEPETRSIPVLVCSMRAANDAPDTADRARRCGAAGHLVLSYSESADRLRVAGPEDGSALWHSASRYRGSAPFGRSAVG
jgi:CheY-like chemotaxis protein